MLKTPPEFALIMQIQWRCFQFQKNESSLPKRNELVSYQSHISFSTTCRKTFFMENNQKN